MPQPRIAILGAGPIGLEAALYAATLGLPVTVYERGQVGEHLQRWGHVRLFSPFGMNATPLGLARIRTEHHEHHLPGEQECLTGRDHRTAYLEPLASCSLLRGRIKTGIQVLAVGRQGLLKEDLVGDPKRAQHPFRLLLRDTSPAKPASPGPAASPPAPAPAPAGKPGQKQGGPPPTPAPAAPPSVPAFQEYTEEADIVLDCTGCYGQPRWLGHGGIPAAHERAARPHVAGGLDDITGEKKGHYADKTTLVIGAGYSAATSIALLADLASKHAGTWVIWLARRTSSQPIRRFVNDSLRERDLIAARANMLATRTDSNVEFRPGALVEAIESRGADKGFLIKAGGGGKSQTFEVDRVISNAGYTPDTDLYRELQVQECYASLGPISQASAVLKHRGGDSLAVTGSGPNLLRNPEPGFYVLGAKSYGRNSVFLLRAGFEQVRDVFTLITGKADLDLYKKR